MKLNATLAVLAGLLIAADDAKDDAKKQLKKFDGTWSLTSIENDGAKSPEDELKRMKLIIEDGKYTLMQEDATISRGTIKVDGSKKPMTIDVTPTEGDGANEEMLGIYEWDGDKMKVCYGRPGEKRPSKMSADSGSGAIMVIATKQKKEKKDT